MYSHVTLYIHQNVNTCTYCNVCITHIFCKASLIALKHDDICFVKKLFKKCCMEINVKIDICISTKYTRDLIKKFIHVIAVFMKEISLNKQSKK